MPLFKERYASKNCAGGNPFLHCRDFAEDNFEWQRYLLLPSLTDPARLLCCPEDVGQSLKCKHGKQTICGECIIPTCLDCCNQAWSGNGR
eukprot:1955555-Karenia_brevis.AAC.1